MGSIYRLSRALGSDSLRSFDFHRVPHRFASAGGPESGVPSLTKCCGVFNNVIPVKFYLDNVNGTSRPNHTYHASEAQAETGILAERRFHETTRLVF